MEVVRDVLAAHRITVVDSTETQVSGRSRATALTFGTTVTAVVEETTAGGWSLTVTASRDPEVLVDYGSSRRLIRAIEAETKRSLSAPAGR